MAAEAECGRPAPRLRPVMLVEDNLMHLDLMLRAFEEQEITNPVVVCRNGEQVLDYMAAHSTAGNPRLPLLVLLDLQLPRVGGIEVLVQARRHPIWKRIPIVVLSTSGQSEDIEAAYESGANSYLLKPTDADLLGEMVRTVKTYWILTNQPPYAAPDTGDP